MLTPNIAGKASSCADEIKSKMIVISNGLNSVAVKLKQITSSKCTFDYDKAGSTFDTTEVVCKPGYMKQDPTAQDTLCGKIL